MPEKWEAVVSSVRSVCGLGIAEASWKPTQSHGLHSTAYRRVKGVLDAEVRRPLQQSGAVKWVVLS